MRLIDADVLTEFIELRYDITWENDYEGGIKDACVDILEKIEKMPSAETELIKCKDCKHWHYMNYPSGKHGGCHRTSPMRPLRAEPDDFCSWAERRQDG